LLKETAGENLRPLLDKIFEFRKSQELLLETNPDLTLGDVTSINVTILQGGKQRNVLPAFIELTVDVRMALTVKFEDFEAMIQEWTHCCNRKVEIEFKLKESYVAPTPIDDSNIYWKGFTEAFNELDINMKTQVFPAGTDAAYIREKGIPAIGFSPINNTPVLLHDHDEYLGADVYLRGIEIYEKILEKICNV
jgi:aminoacylase